MNRLVQFYLSGLDSDGIRFEPGPSLLLVRLKLSVTPIWYLGIGYSSLDPNSYLFTIRDSLETLSAFNKLYS
jgi:hypothetical protein